VNKGKGKSTSIEGIRGETVVSSDSEKLLGIHINSSFDWNTHIDKLVIKLKSKGWVY